MACAELYGAQRRTAAEEAAAGCGWLCAPAIVAAGRQVCARLRFQRGLYVQPPHTWTACPPPPAPGALRQLTHPKSTQRRQYRS
jgi:hypothetical protein